MVMLVTRRFAILLANSFVRPCDVVIVFAGTTLSYEPGSLAVTYTSMLQEAPAANTLAGRLVNVIVSVPGSAVNVPPGHVSDGSGEATITNPAGSVSVIEMPEMLMSGGAVIVILTRLAAPGWMTVGKNDLLTPTGRVVALTTVKSVPVVIAELLPTPWSVVIAPAGIVFS